MNFKLSQLQLLKLSLLTYLTFVDGQGHQLQTPMNRGNVAASFPGPTAPPFNPVTPGLAMSQPPIKEISPLLRSVVSRLEPPRQPNSLSTDQQSTERPKFLQTLIKRLEERKSPNNRSSSFDNNLSLIINDGFSNTVSIEFDPDTSNNEQERIYGWIVDLLADSLANVIREAERLGFRVNFRNMISLTNNSPAVGFGLSINALKTSAG